MKRRRISPKTRTFLLTLGAFALLAAVLVIGTCAGRTKAFSGDRAPTAEKRAAFLARCGWEVDAASEQTQEILIPEEFSPVYQDYNELQKQQGYDLAGYAGRKCTLYTYAVTNYPDKNKTVLADLYLYRDRIIGGDIHSTDLNGFMTGIK